MSEPVLNPGPDLVADRLFSFLLWKGPAVVMLVTAVLGLDARNQGLLWGAALSVGGIGCLVNARRCGRRHCFYTGPFFLAMALASLLHGFGALPLGAAGWIVIGATTLVGAVGLTYLPERIWGKYTARGSGACR